MCAVLLLHHSVIETGDNAAEDRSWLQNLSYLPPPARDRDSSESTSSSPSTPEPKKRKGVKKKSKHETTKAEPKQIPITPDIFRFETRPDADNLRYDSVYSGDVAVYRRKFDCLGLRPNQALKWTDGRSKTSKRKKKGNSAKEDRYFAARLKCESSEVVIPKIMQSSSVNSLFDFIELKVTPSKEGKEVDDFLTAERHMTILTGEYNSSLLEQPHNVSLWLEFLSFQDQLLGWGHLPGEGSDHASRKRQVLVERKLSIYERALEQNPMAAELLMGYMELVREKWETEQVIRKWKDIVFRQPNSSALWLGYIHFCQTNFSSFKTSSVTSVYCKCISTLASILEGTLKSHQPLPDTPASMVAIFSLYCGYLKQAGLLERAIACYQALVEFNLCIPHELEEAGVSLQSMKEFFEPYWDSGMPRFGEDGAMGWSNWSEANKTSSASRRLLGLLPDRVFVSGKEGEGKKAVDDAEGDEEVKKKDVEEVELDLVSGLSVPLAWSVLEEYRTTHNCFPWQPDVGKGESLDDCADPDRIVTFDDVSQTLFKISDPDLKFTLVLSFLSFLGAPRSDPVSHPTNGNSSLRFEALDEALPGASMLLRSGEEASCELPCFPSGIGVSSAALQQFPSLVDLAASLSSRALEDISLDSALPTAASRDFISNICNQGLTLLPSNDQQTELAQLWLAYLHTQLLKKCPSAGDLSRSLKSEIRSIEKVFKELLRLDQHRNNLSLWNSYALFHYSLGNFKDAKKLYQSLLAQVGVVPPDVCCCLCECFTGLRWSRKERSEGGIDRDFALHALVCFSEKKSSTFFTDTVSPSQVLKARTLFSLSEHVSADSANSILCYCYFEYLTRGLKEACKVLKEWGERFEKKLCGATERRTSRCLKAVYLKQLRLLEYHSLTHSLTQPSLTRDLLQRSLKAYPEEAALMAAFIRHEKGSFMSGRMRRYFDKVVEETESVLPWLFAIVAELDRFSRVTGRGCGGAGGWGSVEELSVGTVCRIMSLLSRATSSVSGRHCPLLWRLYMAVQVRWEHRALTACNYWASEASPTLGCSIETSRDIYMYVGLSKVNPYKKYVCQKCVGEVQGHMYAHARKQRGHFCAFRSCSCKVVVA